jgi:GR25 family glycosyltransferase involved in LPS biosynthesis
MDFTLKEEKEPFLCLNMIVKNEAHIIESTLKNLVSKLPIDYWVISDTGSTDKTREKIRKFFQSKNIPGELFDDEWRDFGYNRTKALERAFGKSKYVLIFDADDEIHGEIVLPIKKDSNGCDTLEKDAYNFNFGDSNGVNYTRLLLFNNKMRWRYRGVLHEYIECMEKNHTNDFLNGNYYTVSGRKGNRNKDANKYLNDAIILEKAHSEALKINDPIYIRYAFYCANSYFDCGNYEQAIKWYKITLKQENWHQEKYNSCLKIFYCYRNIQQIETGLFYLIQSWLYDQKRVECIYELIQYYCSNNMPVIAFNYYELIKNFFEEDYLNTDMKDKLFLETIKYNLLLPFYVILVADKVQKYDTALKMFRIVFIKKHIETSKFFIGNLLYNLQFFIDKIDKNDDEFFRLFKEYISFLISIGYNFDDHTFMSSFEKYGIHVKKNKKTPAFTREQCAKSNKILIFTGFSGGVTWNYSYSIQNALGGSETAAACLSNSFPKNYEIYVAGDVEKEKYDNITYININDLKQLVDSTSFHSIIVSRYISFYENYSNFSAYNTYIWAHDIVLLPYGCDKSVNNILDKWNNKITGCICQTNWHKNLFLTQYPTLKEKIYTINNGIKLDLFNFTNKKIPNRFIYSSCVERGLDKLIDLWPKILENLPDAELFVCTYNNFPRNDEEKKILEKINTYESIKNMGKLDKLKLYELMSTTEYWLYPTNFNETSCITSMEMLMSEVICLYYPVAGLVDTLGDYGIQISQGNEVDILLDLTIKQKINIKKRGKEYALRCSWENRAKEWTTLINMNTDNNEVLKTNSYSEKQNNIKIINLKRRTDRKKSMMDQLERENITNYEIIEAVDGNNLKPTEQMRLLFERNDFHYKKGVIGCALSHLHLFNMLINDSSNDYYVILEDDVHLCVGFKEKLNAVCDLFVQQQLEHLALGEYNTKTPINTDSKQLTILTKDNYKIWNVAFAYIISKKCAKNIISYINKCPIKCAIDNQQCSGSVVNYYSLNENIVSCKFINSEFGSDIQIDTGYFHFLKNANDDKIDIKVAFCDWWITEYCGGTFDLDHNFITDILIKYGNVSKITIVQPNEKPDILFYSIFGNYHKNINNCRKVFFSGEPFGIRQDADFNVSFDKNSNKNVRLPLWVCYLNDYLMEECNRRKNGNITVPKREKFCSFIAAGEVKTTHRRTIVEKLSKYKTVDCGGGYLNNIGYTVPRGINCSGKIEHNKNYKFAIAFENEDYPGYVTEKICDIFKSNCIPIYWGTTEVVKDFNPNTFINARDFNNFDELVEYIIKVDNDEQLYSSYFKEPFFSDYWLDIFTDPNKTFYKNLADLVIGKYNNLYYNYINSIETFTNNNFTKKKISIFNIWHNKLFDRCYEKLDKYSMSKITMFDVNQNYEKLYNENKNYNIVKEYELNSYNSLYQNTNYCQTSCLYHVFKNKMYEDMDYIGFIQYDMELEKDFIYNIEQKIINCPTDIFFYNLTEKRKIHNWYLCNPYENSLLEKYNKYFNTNHTYENIKENEKCNMFICLHTFVIPTKTFIKMMNWFFCIKDWLHANYISGLYTQSMSETTEELFGLFLLLQFIEDDSIQMELLKLHHNWEKLHFATNFINYKNPVHYFPLEKIVDSRFTDKNTCHSYLDTYEKLMKDKHLSCKNILEIGVQIGGSLKLWNDYFVNANIYGMDIDDAPNLIEDLERVNFLKMNAYSTEGVEYFLNKKIEFDFIIDDGPHSIESMVYFIQNYTTLLSSDGILIVEDVQDIKWCDTFKQNVPSGYTYETIDLRNIKNRSDDILFIVKPIKM